MTALIVSNEEMDDIMKIVKFLVESGLLIKIKNEAKEQKSRFLSMILGTVGASLLRNLLTRKGIKAKIPGRGVIGTGRGTIRVGQHF